jgi:WhiB family transcriptional regulator, redox-sensing transcriptional regulator
VSDWRERASCRDHDRELFFRIGSAAPALEQFSRAKAVCVRCPVTRQCLSLALDGGQDFGIWGGMTPQERRALRRRNYAQPHAGLP